MAKEEAITKEEAIRRIKAWNLDPDDMEVLSVAIPELRESEDEKIRKLLVWQVHRNIEDETNDLAGSVYDGIKGHDPDLEESIEDWKKCLAWLERQKEQKPVDFPTTDEEVKEFLETHPEEVEVPEKYKTPDFVFSKQEYESHPIISNDTTSVKPAECSEDIIQKAVKEVRLTQHQIDWFKTNVFPPKQEWSEDDDNALNYLHELISFGFTEKFCDAQTASDMRKWLNTRLKSPRPQPHTVSVENATKFGSLEYERGVKDGIQYAKNHHWKPSEEQIDALRRMKAAIAGEGEIYKPLNSLYEQLKKLM